jgi:hypothetical protein
MSIVRGRRWGGRTILAAAAARSADARLVVGFKSDALGFKSDALGIRWYQLRSGDDVR